MSLKVKCLIFGCISLAKNKGLCGMHYKRVQRHGDPEHLTRKKLNPDQNNQSHPLWGRWRTITRQNRGQNVCERWRDFTLFVQDVGDIPETPHQFRRLNSTKLWSKDNYYWAKPLGDYEEHRLKLRDRQRLKRLSDPTYSRRQSLKKNYGITLEYYNELLESQGGVCKICGSSESRANTQLSLDHCHDSKAIRGLLCSNCNTGLGLFKDSPELLQKAINYLRVSVDVIRV